MEVIMADYITECGGVNSKWIPNQIGYWEVIVTDPSWGSIPISFPPHYEDVAKWVASNHGVEAVWYPPTDIPKEG